MILFLITLFFQHLLFTLLGLLGGVFAYWTAVEPKLQREYEQQLKEYESTYYPLPSVPGRMVKVFKAQTKQK